MKSFSSWPNNLGLSMFMLVFDFESWRFPSFATKAEFFPLNGVVESPTGASLATQPGCLVEDVLLLRYIYIYITYIYIVIYQK